MKTYVICKKRGENAYDLKVFNSSEGLGKWFFSAKGDKYSSFMFFHEPSFEIRNPRKVNYDE